MLSVALLLIFLSAGAALRQSYIDELLNDAGTLSRCSSVPLQARNDTLLTKKKIHRFLFFICASRSSRVGRAPDAGSRGTR